MALFKWWPQCQCVVWRKTYAFAEEISTVWGESKGLLTGDSQSPLCLLRNVNPGMSRFLASVHLCLYFFMWPFPSFSVGWGQRPGWQREAHTDLRGLQCQPEPAAAGQLAGHALPVPPLRPAGLCHAALLGAWLRQPTVAITHLSGDADPILQTGRQPEGAGKDLAGRGESCQDLLQAQCYFVWMIIIQC